MGKKKSPSGLGRAIIKERNLSSRNSRQTDSWLHTSELNDGYDWGRLNLQSVTEQNSLDEFLATAELAGTEFVAEKLNIQFVPAEARTGLLTAEESKRIKKLHEENKQFLRIPRRPHWDESTSAEQLRLAERTSFLEWRRELAQLEEEQKLILTPFEKNLEFWRQLWRVLERSDVVVQIVDARNPLLFRCQDLESYAKEISKDKENMILVNKADMLTPEQRRGWAQFFEREGMKVVFWSALRESMRLDAEAKGQELEELAEVEGENPWEKQVDNRCAQGNTGTCGPENILSGRRAHSESSSAAEEEEDSEDYEDCKEEEEDWQTCSEDDDTGSRAGFSRYLRHFDRTEELSDANAAKQRKPVQNSSHLVRREELLEIFKAVHAGKTVKNGEITVGLVGYPNVGKSSTINTILRNKKVSVSSTPGHTKHFQTLYVEPSLCLCDCPGLVMPSFVCTKAEMICCGILPIDQMRDHVPPISLVCQHIPRAVLEAIYGINIVRPREDEDPNRPPTSEELLVAYGYMRGFMTAHGQPDQPRSARYILKDYVNGKLLYCYPPPGVSPADFQLQHERFKEQVAVQEGTKTKPASRRKVKQIENDVDKHFFHQENVRALTKGVQAVMGYKPGSGVMSEPGASTEALAGKPWKKHGNRNKKEKVRRLNKHLDA
ncbi:large subunit GTPase 1 homolog [Latimeria chalumnae]|uniref:Large subunit GTPase 1 homolog n=1 Tax=Latimeria chalumnae TaxID=7897 RepID=H3AZZ8_LATCH|nr:PREDICTED: large subunit GTPase 1 homolog [Latimeria chalumnae]|eukprot:XP_005989431.1 PREDICTED: large subunit GTPase 1 homolog [Latimeria chalumnae]